MAKRKIDNYVFKPGIGALDSLFPNAYTLLSENKDFLIAESIAYINNEISDATKCQRDIGYLIDGLLADVACQSTYYSYFMGLAEYNSLDISNTVIRTIERLRTNVKARAATVYSGATLTALNADIDFYIDEVIDIAQNGRTAADAPTYSTAGIATDRQRAATNLLNNIGFIAAEVNAWVNVTYPAHNHDVAKCTRDVYYAIYAAVFDILYGGNTASYDSAKFFNNYSSSGSTGITLAHQAQTVAAYRHLQSFIDEIVTCTPITKSVGNALTQNTSGTAATSLMGTTAAGLIDIVADVVESGTGALPAKVAYTGSNPYSLFVSNVSTNKTAIINAITWSPSYTYNSAKCQRDLGFVLDAYLYDLRYGGNSETSRVIHYYWDGDVAQVDGNRIPEIDTHAFIGDLITEYILTNTAWTPGGELDQVINTDLDTETYSFTPTDASYSPTTGELTLTIGAHSLHKGSSIRIAEDGITFTCATDGHSTLHPYPRASGVPNASGHDPVYDTPIYISDVTDTTITVNVGISSDISTHIFVSALTSSVTSTAIDKINTLVGYTTSVITNGLSSMPTLVPSGVGTIKIQGKFDTSDLLLITNTDKNEIIYNFGSQAAGGSVTVKDHGDDDDFPKYLQTTDGVTTITLNYNTSSHSSTDSLQIFTENNDVIVRPHDFGTDAIERMRTAPPQSMLDADFEYGLQPTKWAAIATMRGYPSVYEIPGTDTPVSNIVTDASTGTGGVGQSLITVTTVGPHGFLAGDPVTIKALADSISGAARAEGSFVINTVPSSTTFTYFAKSKVGTANGQVLSNSYSQLRKAGFYTGASIGNPSIAVVSNGTSGSITTELAVLAGQDTIPFDGPAPEIGAPLSGTNIPSGAQITAVIDTSAGGGTYVTPTVAETTPIGQNTVEVVNSTGIVNNLAVDRGDGYAIYVTGVAGNTVSFSGNFTSPVVSNTQSYTNIDTTNDTSVGAGATFDISIVGGAYVVTVYSAGLNYKIGDRIRVLGNNLGGSSPTNDLLIRVTAVNAAGGVTTLVSSGTPFDGTASFTGVSASNVGGNGQFGNFDVTWLNNAYTNVSIVSPDSSTGYVVGDRIKIPGNLIDPISGATPLHDLYITVTGVGLGGAITSVSWQGTAPNAQRTYPNVAWTTNGSGIDAVIDVQVQGSSYLVNVSVPGTNFLSSDTITILGTSLGGSAPANNLVLTVTNVDAFGAILTYSQSGTTYNNGAALSAAGDVVIGTGATFDVSLLSGSYTVTVNNGGSGYGVNQQLKILGTSVGGLTPTNDITITITGTNSFSSGTITSKSHTGTAATAAGPFTNTNGQNINNTGSGAKFNVSRDSGLYTSISLNTAGTGYEVGNRVLILGTDLEGTSANNILVRINSVTGGGGIATYTEEWSSAAVGTILRMLSTVVISEATSGTLTRLQTLSYSALATLEATWPTAHGLVPGDTFIVTVSSDSGGNNHALAAGAFIATNIPSIAKIRYQARAAGSINTATQNIIGIIYPRPDSFFIHRPFDGGVQLGTGGPQHGAQAIRQSKKYIRYQSGKGIMYTTGALFAPSYDLRAVSADGVEVGSVITVDTDDNDHGVQIGGVVRLLGIETPGYNSGPGNSTPPDFDYEVVDVDDERTFKVLAKRRLGSTTATLGFGAQMSVVSWHGATVRSGIFDDQNGIFWEYDGTQISVVQRTGTFQVAGTVAINVDSNLVTGTNTRFREQLKAGDRVIIKGMTHVVSHVTSNTSMTVTPDFRGVTNVSGSKIMLISDKKVKQADFNLDRLDGTGPSGYKLDPAKMQMIGIQYSWYGAGFIDFMLRGSKGNFVFAHRMRNSNVNTEAFMRSGNLPVRYEVTNEGPSGKLAASMTNSQTTIELVDGSFFPTAGTVYIDNEIITFTGRNGNTLTGCTRAATFTNYQAGANRSYVAGAATTHDAKTGVILISQTITPLISHWGSAFLTDGMFDEDRGYIFNYAATNVSISTTKQTAFLIRLAPSVSNAIVGDLGERELLNRAQLLLQGIEITSDNPTTAQNGGIVVEGVLNPQNYPVNPSNVGWSGLAGVAQGGQPSFAQVAAGGAITWTSGASSTNASATSVGQISALMNSGIYASPAGQTYIFVSAVDYRNTFGTTDLGRVTGLSITGSTIRAGSIITSGYIDPSSDYGYFYMNQTTTATTNPNVTDAYTINYNSALTARNFAYLTTASFDATGAKVGTSVTGGSVTFPPNSTVNRIRSISWAGQSFYEIQFNNTFSGTLALTSGTIQFTFTQPPYAQPGETVFSFIAAPGERSALDLSQLKELTNTPLGGRGTYPNGPDVMAINVYKVSGDAIPANIVLRWGEAQA